MVYWGLTPLDRHAYGTSVAQDSAIGAGALDIGPNERRQGQMCAKAFGPDGSG